MKKEVQRLLEKADHALEVAELLYKQGFHQDACSKIYYAMFYAAQALLKSEDIEVVKHSAVESALGGIILLRQEGSILSIIVC